MCIKMVVDLQPVKPGGVKDVQKLDSFPVRDGRVQWNEDFKVQESAGRCAVSAASGEGYEAVCSEQWDGSGHWRLLCDPSAWGLEAMAEGTGCHIPACPALGLALLQASQLLSGCFESGRGISVGTCLNPAFCKWFCFLQILG